MSRPTISKGKTSYPIYAASFANSRTGYLLVGGGGGSGKHGVKNQITLFDFSSRAATVEASAEIEVSQDDSVTCLANLATKDGLVVYAGNNSSEEERLKGKNEHFKAFQVQFPTKGAEKTESKISFLSKTTLFTAPQTTGAKKEAYQRLLRLSPTPRTPSAAPTKRIGAIATGLADNENEIVVFSATSNKPQGADIIQRVALPKGQEANDLDILDQSEGRFQVAYALDHEIHLQGVHYDFEQRKTKGNKERRKVYTIPHLDVSETKPRPKFRGIRWLSPKHLLLLVNKHNRTGVELLVLHLYEEGPGSIILRKTLPKHVKAATDMDVAWLDPDTEGAYQIAVAIGAIDISLSVFTIDYHGDARNSLSKFHSYATYEDVHEVQMTKVVFSSYYRTEASASQVQGPQYLRLASTSLGNTISVDTFTLQSIGSRHVLQTARTRNLYQAATYLSAAMIVLAIALMIQSFIDPEGSLTNSIIPSSLRGASKQYRPAGEVFRDRREALLNNENAPAIKASQRLHDLLHRHKMSSDSSTAQKALVIHHDPETDGQLSTEVHDGHEAVLKKHAQARKWDELSKEEQKAWKKKLTDAGMWAVGEGETILKSIFFGQIGGLVGHVAQGVLG